MIKHVSCFVLTICTVCMAKVAYADYFKVYTPRVEAGEITFETDLNYSSDQRKSYNNYLSQVYGLEYGVNQYWQAELSGEIEKSADQSMQLTNIKFENIVVPFKSENFWLDTGLYAEIEKSVLSHTPDNAEVGLLLNKAFSGFDNSANIFLGRNFGPNAARGINISYSWQTTYQFSEAVKPGFEYYTNYSNLFNDNEFEKHQDNFGPVLLGNTDDFRYDTGILFGMSRYAAGVTLKLNMEFDF